MRLIKGEMTPITWRIDTVRGNRTTAGAAAALFTSVIVCFSFIPLPSLHSKVTKHRAHFTRLLINMILLSVSICISHQSNGFFCLSFAASLCKVFSARLMKGSLKRQKLGSFQEIIEKKNSLIFSINEKCINECSRRSLRGFH